MTKTTKIRVALSSLLLAAAAILPLHGLTASSPRTTTICQVEENGELIAYPTTVTPRPDFVRVACPKES